MAFVAKEMLLKCLIVFYFRLNFVLQQLFSDEKIRIAELSGSRGRNRCSELLSKFSRGQING